MPNYHGHNYTLIVKVTGEVDPETGYLIDLGKLGHIIDEEITERYDHKNLNLDTEDFNNITPSTENFAAVIWNRLQKRLGDHLKLSIVLYETERNFVEYHGE